MVSTERVLIKRLSNETVINNAVLSKKGIYCTEGAVLESFSDISGKFRRFIKTGTPKVSKMGLVNRVNNANRKKIDPQGGGSIPLFVPVGGGSHSPFPKQEQIAGNPAFHWPLLISDHFSSPKAPKRSKSRKFPRTTFSYWPLFSTEKLKNWSFPLITFGLWQFLARKSWNSRYSTHRFWSVTSFRRRSFQN